jgi:hypothetical protein
VVVENEALPPDTVTFFSTLVPSRKLTEPAAVEG